MTDKAKEKIHEAIEILDRYINDGALLPDDKNDPYYKADAAIRSILSVIYSEDKPQAEASGELDRPNAEITYLLNRANSIGEVNTLEVLQYIRRLEIALTTRSAPTSEKALREAAAKASLDLECFCAMHDSDKVITEPIDKVIAALDALLALLAHEAPKENPCKND
jgi:hypothetical protein